MDKRRITIFSGGKKSVHYTASRLQTKKIAERLANELRGGAVVTLSGELGAGKTAFASGIARGLGIRETVTSPTFVIMLVYPLSRERQIRHKAKLLCHIDTYRLSTLEELMDLGVKDYLGNPDVITIIEWPEKIETLIPPTAIRITLEHC